MTNPYTLTFGKKPQQYIARPDQTQKIIDTFSAELPASQVYMITGIRGSGKTVMLTEISSFFEEQEDWIVLNLSTDANIMDNIASRISSRRFIDRYFPHIAINLPSMTISFDKNTAEDSDSVLRRFFTLIREKGKKILFVIDEIVKNEYVKTFVSFFQIYLREEFPVYLLMAGLYENISDLQNEKTLTFLYRTPRISLEPLNLPAMAASYRETLHLQPVRAVAMARLTKGYSFAFQVLGYLLWEHGQDLPQDRLLALFDADLAQYAYDKIWNELSALDRRVVTVISQGVTDVKSIRQKLQISPQLLNVYRRRLIDQGVVDGSARGTLTLALPRFEVYVEMYGVI